MSGRSAYYVEMIARDDGISQQVFTAKFREKEW
jgi:hypothetical protein